MPVDGTDCAINEPRPFSSKWYSHKLNGPAVRYEVAVSLKGEIVAVNCPYEAGNNPDIKIFRKGLKNFLSSDEKVLTDEGYKDTKCIFPSLLTGMDRKIARNYRVRNEVVNGRIKKFVCVH